jgi:endonuclease-3 related protein
MVKTMTTNNGRFTILYVPREAAFFYSTPPAMLSEMDLQSIYEIFLNAYGPQGWWPVLCMKGTPEFDERGYHPGLYTIPENGRQRWEIQCGAILTQNTAWKNVEKAMTALFADGIDSPEAVSALTHERLAELIRPSGYYNQKTDRLKLFADFVLSDTDTLPSRKDLLALKGIGPETADSMLLYAWHQPVFVVDLYTVRLLIRTGCVSPEILKMAPVKRYEHVQNFITLQFYHTRQNKEPFYSEFHGLILQHAKQHCSSKPSCISCPLEQQCPKMLY